jgi:hypothetical protein
VTTVDNNLFNNNEEFVANTTNLENPISEPPNQQNSIADIPFNQEPRVGTSDNLEDEIHGVWKIIWRGPVVDEKYTIGAMGYEVIWESNLKNKDEGERGFVWHWELDNCDELLAVFNESLKKKMSDSERELWNIENQRRGPISAKYGLNSRIMDNSIGSESIQVKRLLRTLESHNFSSKYEIALRNYRLKLRSVTENSIQK